MKKIATLVMTALVVSLYLDVLIEIQAIETPIMVNSGGQIKAPHREQEQAMELQIKEQLKASTEMVYIQAKVIEVQMEIKLLQLLYQVEE